LTDFVRQLSLVSVHKSTVTHTEYALNNVQTMETATMT